MNNNFDMIFKRMANFKQRFDAIDQFLDKQFQLDVQGEVEGNELAFIEQQDVEVVQPELYPEDTTASSDSYYRRRTVPLVPVPSQPAKRSPQDAEFSSPEESLAYKLLKS